MTSNWTRYDSHLQFFISREKNIFYFYAEMRLFALDQQLHKNVKKKKPKKE